MRTPTEEARAIVHEWYAEFTSELGGPTGAEEVAACDDFARKIDELRMQDARRDAMRFAELETFFQEEDKPRHWRMQLMAACRHAQRRVLLRLAAAAERSPFTRTAVATEAEREVDEDGRPLHHYCDCGGWLHRWSEPDWLCPDCGMYQLGCEPKDTDQ